MAVTQEEAGAVRRRERVGIIDCDVHNSFAKLADLKQYLPQRWHVYWDQGSPSRNGALMVGAPQRNDIYRRDSYTTKGTPGCDFELMREQLLDRYGVVKAILHPVMAVLAAPQYGEFGGACAAAINDWMVEEWLERDDRFWGAISVPVEDGEQAAREIDRAAQHPRFVKVLLTMQTREGMGHPKYWPIYEAATAHGLKVAAHVGGFSGTHLATGQATYFVEKHAGYTQPYQAQVVSLVYSGVFDRFPTLEFVLEEGGVAWLPSLMWRLDRTWESMRDFAPHLTRPPSEVIRERIAFTTQPFDEPERPAYLVELLDQLGMDDRIMFSSDWPHWDFDDPTRVLPVSVIGKERREKIMSLNAERFFDFDRRP
jgi:predicted TIM-barrel fold metal-dependent hydrolase